MEQQKRKYDRIRRQIKTLYIYHVDLIYDVDYIMSTIYDQQLAKVKKVTLVPYKSNIDGQMYYEAYVDIMEWYDTEYVDGFLDLLNCKLDPNYDVYLYHYNDEWWPVKPVYVRPTNIIENISKTYDTSYYNQVDIENKINDEIEVNLDRSDVEWLTMSYYLSKKCAESIL